MRTKSTKNTKNIKSKQVTFTQTFYTRIKSIKAQNVKQVFLDVFIAHKNAVFFVFVRLDNFKLLCFLRESFTQKKH